MQRQIVPIVPSLKRLKHKNRLRAEKSSFETIPSPKSIAVYREIKAIPLIRVNINNNIQEKQRLALKGYKYFSNLTASGENTENKLENIKKSKSLKLIKKFEFDAYLCKNSCIKPLSKIFKNLGMTTNLTLIFRR